MLRCRHGLTLNKSKTSRDFNSQNFLDLLVNLGNFDETVQRVDGVVVIDATSIYDSMYGASGPPAMEEKRTDIETMGIQARNETTDCDCTMVSRRSTSQ